MAAPRSASALAAVKVNLYLDVLARRGDGYHDLETVFLSVPWGDDVTVTLEGEPRDGAPRIDLEARGPIAVPTGEENLAWRAAAAFLAAAGESSRDLPGRVRVRLEKRVPPGSGLGGGSADAAAVLRLLDGLLPGAVAAPQLEILAAGLGADVPFLLRGGAAVGRGRGERLDPVAAGGPLEIVLVLPPVGCDTERVFGALVRFRPAPRHGLQVAVGALRDGDPGRVREAHYNALAFTVLKVHPPLRRFTADVERRLGRPPAMSGSGSALFDVVAPGESEGILARLEGLPGSRVVARV